MRKDSLRKNAVVLTVLVLVGAAVFINWKFSPPAETANSAVSGEESGRKLLGQSTLVSGEGDSSADPAGEDAVYTGTDYFASARLTRQQARDNAVNLLQEAMSYSESSKEAESAVELEQIVQTALSEAQIESLIIAKGYADCVAYMSGEGISIAVASPEGGLQREDVAVIADIVMAQSDYSLNDIRVVEVQ